MAPVKTLKWGETPWDDMTREELLREAQRMFAACLSANSVLSMMSYEGGPYWTSGAGFRAFRRTRAVVRSVDEKYDSESVYSSFFRYAVDLLFSPEDGFCWRVCDKCGVMLGSNTLLDASNGYMASESCHDKKCSGAMRPIEWKDLEPENGVE